MISVSLKKIVVHNLKFKICMLVVSLIIFLTIFFMGTLKVSAISAFDNAYQTVDDLVISSNDYYGSTCSGETFNNENSWVNIILEDYYWDRLNSNVNTDHYMDIARSEFLDAVSEGNSIYISNLSQDYGKYKTALINFDVGTNDMIVGFYDAGTYVYTRPYYPNDPTGNTMRTITVGIEGANWGGSSCNVVITNYSNVGLGSRLSDNMETVSGMNYKAFKILNFELNLQTYPIAYDGEIIENYIEPIVLISPPEIDYSIIDNKGIFRSVNYGENVKIGYFITYGSIDGEPQIEMWDYKVDLNENNVLEHEFKHIALESEEDKYGTYTIQAYYLNEDNVIISEITNMYIMLSQKNINIFDGVCVGDNCDYENRINLNSFDYGLESCTVSETFPYIALGDCVNNIGGLLNLLRFKDIKISNVEEYTKERANCDKLTVLHSWLLLDEDTIICRQFSDEILDVVTGFMILGLGILSLNMIIKSKVGDK